LTVVVESFTRSGANVDRNFKIDLTIFFIFFFMWLPSIAIESAVNISIPSFTPSLEVVSFMIALGIFYIAVPLGLIFLGASLLAFTLAWERSKKVDKQ